MLPWLFLLLLLVVEVAALVWWLRREFYPFFFNVWAPLIYTSVLLLDFALTRIVSLLLTPGGTEDTLLLVILGVFLFLVVLAYTFFFRWAVRQDMMEPPPD